MKRTARLMLGAPVLALIFAGCTAAEAGTPEPPSKHLAPMVHPAVYTAEAAHNVAVWNEAVWWDGVADEWRRVYAEQVAAAEAQRAAKVPTTTTRSTPQRSAPTESVGGECGGATNGADRFIGRESGGNPGVWNSGGSGAWGCYQIMPGTWHGAGCDELGAHGSASAAAQAECASRLPMSAWNASG